MFADLVTSVKALSPGPSFRERGNVVDPELCCAVSGLTPRASALRKLDVRGVTAGRSGVADIGEFRLLRRSLSPARESGIYRPSAVP